MHGLHKIWGGTKSMMTYNKTNGQWEGQNLMEHDELRDMGCLLPMRKKA
jgi:hypothetical protein